MKKTRKEGKKEGRRKEGRRRKREKNDRRGGGAKVTYVRKHYDLGIPYSSKFLQVFNFAKF